MARVTSGRVVRPSNLAERRLMLRFGAEVIRVPRCQNPYIVARKLERAARSDGADVACIMQLVVRGIGPTGQDLGCSSKADPNSP